MGGWNMELGSLGDIPFEVSSEKVRTFDELNRSGSARFAYHNRQGSKELSEFLGASLEDITMQIRLSVTSSVNPANEMKALRKIRDEGTAVLFVLDGEPQGDGYWNIVSLNEEHKVVDRRGRTLLLDVSVTLKEYLPTRE